VPARGNSMGRVDRAATSQKTIRVQVRLFATLRQLLPTPQSGHVISVELPAKSTIEDVIRAVGIPGEMVRMILVDGRFVRDRHTRLQSDCTLSLFPPLAGG